jgi:aminopeptidase N
MAHQWWGGVISWFSYRDEWITEGFATLASVLYLEQKMSAGRFAHLIARMKKWVFEYADCGPPVYGLRIANLEGSYEAFQSVVYLKTALVLLMLRDMLGEEDFFTRLRFFLAKFKYKSITSITLINEISRKEKWLQDFFNGWLFSRKTPEVFYEVQLAGNSAELRITQKDSVFVFPLQVRIATARGSRIQSIIVLGKEQVFKFAETTAIESLKVNAAATPVLIKN